MKQTNLTQVLSLVQAVKRGCETPNVAGVCPHGNSRTLLCEEAVLLTRPEQVVCGRCFEAAVTDSMRVRVVVDGRQLSPTVFDLIRDQGALQQIPRDQFFPVTIRPQSLRSRGVKPGLTL